MEFRTVADVREFLSRHGQEYCGIYETYRLNDGRTIKFTQRRHATDCILGFIG